MPDQSTPNTAGGPPYRVPDLAPLISPRSIAVVGASDRPGGGSLVLQNLRQLGYAGAVYPINPKYKELAGWRCYGSLAELPGPVDSVAILSWCAIHPGAFPRSAVSTIKGFPWRLVSSPASLSDRFVSISVMSTGKSSSGGNADGSTWFCQTSRFLNAV